jgi:hypothetical protein
MTGCFAVLRRRICWRHLNPATIIGSFSPATIVGAGASTLTLSLTGPSPLAGSGAVAIIATGGSISQSIWAVVDGTQLGQIKAPAFSVPAGTYAAPQGVTISGFSSSTRIYYTTDGATPTVSSPL